jgi:REP element-mobilizing transposase RayT
MRYKLDKGAHSVYALQYHFVQVVKYRKQVFDDEKIIDLLKQKIREINGFEVTVLNIECDKDNFHMIFKLNQLL